jgi:hypothetical protein
MRYKALAAGLLTLGFAACATVGSVFERERQTHFDTGVRALKAGDYATASENLGWVAQQNANDELGQQALLMVAALEMDPRNPQRRLPLGSDLAGSYLKLSRAPIWTTPVAETLYLLAVELGAAEDRAAQAQADREQAENRLRLPENSPTVTSRLRSLSEEKDKLAKRVTQLEEQVADREKKLAEKDKELERIRKTLKS